MMELWPFTNFHDLNLDWIIKTIKEWVGKMTDVLDEWHTMEDDWQEFIDNTYKEQITEILAEHPEWTTTVQDGVITFSKLSDSLKVFVTPETFGAAGDGVTDDSAAWQDAIDSGYNVMAVSPIYRIDTPLAITNDVDIDCNNAEFIVNSSTLFDAEGHTGTILGNQLNYNAGEIITIQDHNGVVELASEDYLDPNYNLSLNGVMTELCDGTAIDQYPFDLTNITATDISALTVNISNIKNVSFSDTTNSVVIKAKYNNNSTFNNINMTNECYSVVFMERCINCIVESNRYNLPAYTNGTRNYPVELGGSSKCIVKNTEIYTITWHCFDIGNNIAGYKNIIDNCTFRSTNQVSINCHDAAIDLEVYNSIFTGASMIHGFKVVNCVVETAKVAHLCSININGSGNNTIITNCVVENVVFNHYNVPVGNAGVIMNSTATNNYINKVTLSNLSSGVSTPIYFTFSNVSTNTVENIYITNFTGIIIPRGYGTVNISDCRSQSSANPLNIGNSDSDIYNSYINVSNCTIDAFRGSYEGITISDCYLKNTVTCTARTEFYGNNLYNRGVAESRLKTTATSVISKLMLSNVFDSNQGYVRRTYLADTGNLWQTSLTTTGWTTPVQL